MNKAQFEILGLAIIVIIVSIAIFFILAFGSNNDNSNPSQQFQEEQFAQNTLDALLKTNLPAGCSGTLADYFGWIYAGNWPRNPPPGSICEQPPINHCTNNCGDGYVCIKNQCYDPTTLQGILEKTFTDYLGQGFYFEARTPPCPTPRSCSQQAQGFFIQSETPLCDPNTQDTSRAGRQIISLYPNPENAEIVLWICKP